MIVVAGMSHRTAPIAVRERFAVSHDELGGVLTALVARPGVREAVVVSTCNRVDVVVAGEGSAAELTSELHRAVGEREKSAAEHLQSKSGREAAHHLLRVACSLDSLVVGEPQILGQVRDAVEASRAAGTLGTELSRVFAQAVRAGKRVRSETAIGAGQVSVPSVAVDLARQIFGELTGRTAALVGSGEMAETAARLLRGAGARLLVVGRNAERVRAITAQLGGDARRWEELHASLIEADVVVTSTSAPGFVIDRAEVDRVRRARRGRSLFLVDLAVPRDVEPNVEKLDGVFRYDVDDLSSVVAESMQGRLREAEQAEQIVLVELEAWERRTEAAQATPTIVSLRERVRAVLGAELERSLRGRLKHLGDADRESLNVMLEAAVNKLLHAPSQRLREAAEQAKNDPARLSELAAALGELFDLDGNRALEPPLDSEPETDPAGESTGPPERATGTERP